MPDPVWSFEGLYFEMSSLESNSLETKDSVGGGVKVQRQAERSAQQQLGICALQWLFRLGERFCKDLREIRLTGFAGCHPDTDVRVLGLQDIGLVTGRLHPAGDGFRWRALPLGDVFPGTLGLIFGLLHTL